MASRDLLQNSTLDTNMLNGISYKLVGTVDLTSASGVRNRHVQTLAGYMNSLGMPLEGEMLRPLPL